VGPRSAVRPLGSSPTTRSMDWCWRAQLAGKRILYDPSATVEHRRSASSGGEHQPWVRVMSERNRTLTMVRKRAASARD